MYSNNSKNKAAIPNGHMSFELCKRCLLGKNHRPRIKAPMNGDTTFSILSKDRS